MFGFPVSGLCEKFSDETQFETRITRCHRLFAHLRSRLYRGEGFIDFYILTLRSLSIIITSVCKRVQGY